MQKVVWADDSNDAMLESSPWLGVDGNFFVLLKATALAGGRLEFYLETPTSIR